MLWYILTFVTATLVTNLIASRLIRKAIMSNQEKLNVIATQLGAISGQFAKGLNEVSVKIDQLKNQAPEELDFGPVQDKLASLGLVAEALDAIVPDEIDAEDPDAPEQPVEPTEPSTPEVPETPETPVEVETPATDPEIATSNARGRKSAKPANADEGPTV
jgi:hypothetical protein